MDRGERVTLFVLVVFVGVVAVLPMLRLLFEAVAPGGQFGIDAILRAWVRPATQTALAHTLTVGVAGTLLSLALGLALALLVALTDIRGRAAIVFCFMLPLMIAPQVSALAWIQAFGPNSALLKALGLAPPPGAPNPLYGPGGIILLLGLQHAPLVFLAVRAGLRRLPRDLVEAAQAAGASPLRVVRDVVLPMILPAMVAGTGLAFVSAIGNFGIPALLGIPAGYTVLVTLIYQRLAGFGPLVLPEVAALALLLALIALVGLALQRWRAGRSDVRAVSLAAAAPGWRLGRWRGPVEMAVWSFLTVILALPLSALLATSLVPAYGVALSFARATSEHYAYVLFDYPAARRAFANSFALAGAAAGLLMLVSVPLAVLAEWRGRRLLRVLTAVAEFPYALPGVVLAIAMILVFIRPIPILGLGIYNTVWIILLAYLARFLTLALRPVAAGLAQLDRSLDEAAQGCGAGFLVRLRSIVFPLVLPSAAAGAILVFLTAFNELTVSALLWSSGSETLGVIVFSLEQAGETTAAAAVAMLTVLATLGLMLAGSLLGRRLPPGVLPWRA